MSIRARITVVSLALALSATAMAAPSPGIKTLMATPASTFDLFMFRLYESVKCKNWTGEVESEPDFCMTSLHYDADRDLLSMHFRAYPTNESLGDFLEVEDLERQDIVVRYVEQVARIAGVESDWGLLRSMPLRHAGTTKIQDEEKIRLEIASRTQVHIHVTYGSKVYTAVREPDGQVSFSLTKRGGVD
jgi:hypothetical protein